MDSCINDVKTECVKTTRSFNRLCFFRQRTYKIYFKTESAIFISLIYSLLTKDLTAQSLYMVNTYFAAT